ncbi:hypothetical protein D3C71_1254790 [compost metagenome]
MGEHLAIFRMRPPMQHPRRMQMRVVDDFVQFTNRRARHAMTHQTREQLFLACLAGLLADRTVKCVHICNARRPGRKAAVRQPLLASKRMRQRGPVTVVRGEDGDVPIRGGVDVVGRHGQAAMPGARALAALVATAVQAQAGEQARIDGAEHGDLHGARPTGRGAFV